MAPLRPLLLIPVLSCAVGVSAASAPRIEVQERQLANGMRFLLVERHDSPTIGAVTAEDVQRVATWCPRDW